MGSRTSEAGGGRRSVVSLCLWSLVVRGSWFMVRGSWETRSAVPGDQVVGDASVLSLHLCPRLCPRICQQRRSSEKRSRRRSSHSAARTKDW